MTPAELREAVARAMREDWRDVCDIRGETLDWEDIEESERNSWRSNADAALRVVREAMREPSEEMLRKAGAAPDGVSPRGGVDWLGRMLPKYWRAMLAASPLREE